MKNTYLSGKIRFKENSWIARIAAKKLGTSNIAIVIGTTIHLHNATKTELLNNERWLRHELCHLQQFKQYGFLNFIVRYLHESIKNGYYDNKFEIEAREAETL